MKRTIFALITLLSISCAFVACDDDNDEDIIYTHSQTPDLEAAGVYEGTWTRTLLKNSEPTDDIVDGIGTLTIESDTAYLISLKFECEELGLAQSAIANITYSNGGYYYLNYSTANDLKCAFTGTIDDEGVNTISFTVTQVDGRRVKYFKYVFSGTKTASAAPEPEAPVEGDAAIEE